MTTPTQQIEAAAEKAAAELRKCMYSSGYASDFGMPRLDDKDVVPILLRFVAQLMQTGAMKDIEEALERSLERLSQNRAPATRRLVTDALASISVLKGLGEGKP